MLLPSERHAQTLAVLTGFPDTNVQAVGLNWYATLCATRDEPLQVAYHALRVLAGREGALTR